MATLSAHIEAGIITTELARMHAEQPWTLEDARANNNAAIRFGIASGNHLAVAWLYDTFPLTFTDACAECCWALRHGIGNGHRESVEWLLNKFPKQNVEDVGCFGMYSNSDYFAKKDLSRSKCYLPYSSTFEDRSAIILAVMNGNHDTAEWCCQRFGITDMEFYIRKPFKEAVARGHHESVEWYTNKFDIHIDHDVPGYTDSFSCAYSVKDVEASMRNGYHLTVQWLITRLNLCQSQDLYQQLFTIGMHEQQYESVAWLVVNRKVYNTFALTVFNVAAILEVQTRINALHAGDPQADLSYRLSKQDYTGAAQVIDAHDLLDYFKTSCTATPVMIAAVLREVATVSTVKATKQ